MSEANPMNFHARITTLAFAAALTLAVGFAAYLALGSHQPSD